MSTGVPAAVHMESMHFKPGTRGVLQKIIVTLMALVLTASFVLPALGALR